MSGSVVIGSTKQTLVTDRQGAVIVLDKSVSARINANRPSVSVGGSTRSTVTRASSPVTVGGAGPQGPKGEPGGSIAPYSFAFGDATPAAVWTADAAGILSRAKLIITQAFDGDEPDVSLGLNATVGNLIPSDYVDLVSGYEVEVTPDIPLIAGDQVRLRINPGLGASTGAGIVMLTFLPY